MLRALAVAHVVLAILLAPLTLAAGLLAPVFMIGSVWGAVLGVRLWKRAPNAVALLRRTHAVYLAIDGLLIAAGFWMLDAGAQSAARGGGLLSGIGVLPIALGVSLAGFSLLMLVLTRRSGREAALS
jgi:hypothetical protein